MDLGFAAGMVTFSHSHFTSHWLLCASLSSSCAPPHGYLRACFYVLDVRCQLLSLLPGPADLVLVRKVSLLRAVSRACVSGSKRGLGGDCSISLVENPNHFSGGS